VWFNPAVLGALAGRRGVVAVLALIVVLGFALRANAAASPNTAHQSSDEYSYVTIAQALAEHGTYGGSSDLFLRWPPGTPMFFAVAQKLDGSGVKHGKQPDIPSAYWAQAVVGTGTILAVFAMVALLAGAVPALVAAAVTAFYPPLFVHIGDLLSEPLGAFTLACALLAVVWAVVGGDLRRYALAGFLLGLAILTRADFLFLPLPLGVLLVLAQRRAQGWRRPLVCAVVLAAVTGLTILPWTVYVSHRAHKLTPVTTGDAPVLFVGTYLQGDGTTGGMKRELAGEARRFTQYKALKHAKAQQFPAGVVLDAVAARHPGLDRESALREEALDNLRYDVKHPFGYVKMTLAKIGRMWLHVSRIGSTAKPGWVSVVHLLVLFLSLAGLVAGLIRSRRRLELGILALVIVYGTAIHAFLVSQARYNVPLMPLLIAGGVAGGALAWRSRSPAAARGEAGEPAAPEPAVA
jgi:4-amino-4-deoxy-L-arabinose transferase-like glycosyltransferase